MKLLSINSSLAEANNRDISGWDDAADAALAAAADGAMLAAALAFSFVGRPLI